MRVLTWWWHFWLDSNQPTNMAEKPHERLTLFYFFFSYCPAAAARGGGIDFCRWIRPDWVIFQQSSSFCCCPPFFPQTTLLDPPIVKDDTLVYTHNSSWRRPSTDIYTAGCFTFYSTLILFASCRRIIVLYFFLLALLVHLSTHTLITQKQTEENEEEKRPGYNLTSQIYGYMWSQ